MAVDKTEDTELYRLGRVEKALDDIVGKLDNYQVLVHRIAALEKSKDRIMGALITLGLGLVLLAFRVLFGVEVSVDPSATGVLPWTGYWEILKHGSQALHL